MGDKALSAIYYRPGGYWRGRGAIKKLASAAKVPEAEARAWLYKQDRMADLFAGAALHTAAHVR
jgi:hypothetical protein